MKLDGYIRVSRVRGREGESFLSPQDQRKIIQAYADAHGHDVLAWHEELDQSGGKMDRPEFTTMMGRVESGETDGVIVAKLDRFARTVVGALEAIKTMAERKPEPAALICVQEGFDPSTAYGKAFMTIALVFAELELDRIKASWRSSLENVVVERGIQPTIAPYGYRKDESKRFVIDPDEAEGVRLIFSMRKSGEQWQTIADRLNDAGMLTRRGVRWTRSAVKDLTRREAYLGVVYKGDLRNTSAHEPLVSKADWLAVQDVFAHGTSKPDGRGYLLSSLVRCASCSHTMSGGGYKRAGKPERTRQYVCKKRHSTGTCPTGATINTDRLDAYIVDRFFAWAGERELTAASESPDLADALDALAEAQAERDTYRDDRERERLLGRDSYIAGLRVLAEAVDVAQENVETARRAANGTTLPPVATLRELWETLNTRERRALLGAAIDCAVVRPGRGDVSERVRICWKGEAPSGLSGIGKAAPIEPFRF